MARLIVEALPFDRKSYPANRLLACVSVSRADDGQPVTGLTKRNFRVTNLNPLPYSDIGYGLDFNDYLLAVTERTWDPADAEASGVYDLEIRVNTAHHPPPLTGDRFEDPAYVVGITLGIQVRTFGIALGPVGPGGLGNPGQFHPKAVDFGQGLVSLFQGTLLLQED